MTTPTPEDPRRRLARLIEQRADELGLTWNEVASGAGLSKQGLHGVRFGTGRLRRLTKAGLEDALHWEQGSIDAILAGGDPVKLPPSTRIASITLTGPDPSYERRRIAREIAAELAADIQSGLEELIVVRLEELEERRRHRPDKERDESGGARRDESG